MAASSFLLRPFPQLSNHALSHARYSGLRRSDSAAPAGLSLRFPSHNTQRQRQPQKKKKKNIGGAQAIFTGIVEEMGTVQEVGAVGDGFEMKIGAGVALEGVKLGDSIAVNGTCLTVIRFDESSFSVGLAPETLRRTSLGEVKRGSKVNLERSLQPTSRMGGHFVQGHVDGTGIILSKHEEADSLWIKVGTTSDILKYVVPKGYIAVDGTSLTVVDIFPQDLAFNFMLVTYTQQHVVIPSKPVGGKVNLEVDIVGKYVERLVSSYSNQSS